MTKPDIQRIENALMIAAELAEADPVYIPIFARLDAEYSAAIASDNPVERMRARIKLQGAA